MKNPYYIVAPRYARTSAGVRVLYKLCDQINKAGGSAFIFLWPRSNYNVACSPMDVAPFLTKKIAQYHYENKLTPIVIYPEVFNITRFNPPIGVRYILNYNELLFKNRPLDEDDYLLTYSKNLAIQIQNKTSKPNSTIFLPVSDPAFFRPPEENSIRSGAIFYAGKYKYHFGGTTFPITDGLPEITRDQPNSQSPEEIRKLFQTKELFYCYEDSALALEAMLCGCPVVFLPNKFFTETLANKELAGLGYAWGMSPEDIHRAKESVHLVRVNYEKLQQDAANRIAKFIDFTQTLSLGKSYNIQFAINILKNPSLIEMIISYCQLVKDVIQEKGFIATIKTIVKRIFFLRWQIFS